MWKTLVHQWKLKLPTFLVKFLSAKHFGHFKKNTKEIIQSTQVGDDRSRLHVDAPRQEIQAGQDWDVLLADPRCGGGFLVFFLDPLYISHLSNIIFASFFKRVLSLSQRPPPRCISGGWSQPSEPEKLSKSSSTSSSKTSPKSSPKTSSNTSSSLHLGPHLSPHLSLHLSSHLSPHLTLYLSPHLSPHLSLHLLVLT